MAPLVLTQVGAVEPTLAEVLHTAEGEHEFARVEPIIVEIDHVTIPRRPCRPRVAIQLRLPEPRHDDVAPPSRWRLRPVLVDPGWPLI